MVSMGKVLEKVIFFAGIAILATILDFFAHEMLNQFFADDTTRPFYYYAAKVVAFVIAFVFVDFFYGPIEGFLGRFKVELSRPVLYAIAGTAYFAVYYALVAPAFVLPPSASILTLLHGVFIFVSATILTRISGEN